MPPVEATIQEYKHLLNGDVQRFDCLLVAASAHRVVIRFDHTAARTAGGYLLPAGSHTLGLFWSGRHYNVYRIAGPDGGVIAYRFDVVDGVRIRPGLVRFTDLLLDAWRGPGSDGRLRIEDEEEVEAAQAAGMLSPRRRQIIAGTRRLLERGHQRIVAEVEAEVRALDCSNGTARLCCAQEPARDGSDGAEVHNSV